MRRVVEALRGWPGKPSHPPLTDATIGAYTVGVAMLVLGAVGLEEEAMAHGALIAIGAGLVFALPTALTGFLDWLEIPIGTPARTTATIHLLAMLGATALFAFAFAVQIDGYDAGRIESLALVLGLVAEAALVVGGYIGGTLVYHYGVRVLAREETPVGDALAPRRAGDDPGPDVGDDGDGDGDHGHRGGTGGDDRPRRPEGPGNSRKDPE